MATYLKRTSKLFDPTLNRDSGEVNLRDIICPICRGILIEPVTLPCTHNLCLRCLKGTFEHNSLSCPLCRVRVGSWLRTATKTESLVNAALWGLIRSRFPKEIEGKHSGDDGDIELDSGFASKRVILSAAGEIRREYEAQLKIAEEEMRRRRESELLANEALIRKIHAEEHDEQFSKRAKDEQSGKNVGKRQPAQESGKGGGNWPGEEKKCWNDAGNEKSREKLENHRMERTAGGESSNYRTEKGEGTKRSEVGKLEIESKKSLSIISKIRANRQQSTSKIGPENAKDAMTCEKSIHNAVTQTLKSQITGKYVNSTISEPSCSGTQIYGTRVKEELQVPIDLIGSGKKKIIDVEVCVTSGEPDERIGSAESAASHDSINQEIHHFKPIRPIARTPLKISHDGRPIDPKLVRVVSIVKRVSNAVPKAPSPTHIKRIIGCSWSAFRGKARENLELRRKSPQPEVEMDEKVGSGTFANQTIKVSKSQPTETSRRLELSPEVGFDSNKNYAKGINRIMNGTKVSKKLILDDELTKTCRTTKISSKMTRSKKSEKKSRDRSEAASSCSPRIANPEVRSSTSKDETIENIAERIKRRKCLEIREKPEVIEPEVENDVKMPKISRSTRKRSNKQNETETTMAAAAAAGNSSRKKVEKSAKRRKSIDNNVVDDGAGRSTEKKVERKLPPETAKNSTEIGENSSSSSSSSRTKGLLQKIVSADGVRLDEQIIEEQARMERLIMQEKEDFELALRLQSQFDDMERIGRRTRGSRRAIADREETNDFCAEKKSGGERGIETRRGNAGQVFRASKPRRRAQKQAVK